MNIRYPIYEGVYRILTLEEDRENPCRSHHRLFMAGVLFPATFQKPGIPFPFPL